MLNMNKCLIIDRFYLNKRTESLFCLVNLLVIFVVFYLYLKLVNQIERISDQLRTIEQLHKYIKKI